MKQKKRYKCNEAKKDTSATKQNADKICNEAVLVDLSQFRLCRCFARHAVNVSHVSLDVTFEVIVADVARGVTFHVSVRFCDGIKFLLTDFALHVTFDVSL